jgi:hypothetical protein
MMNDEKKDLGVRIQWSGVRKKRKRRRAGEQKNNLCESV